MNKTKNMNKNDLILNIKMFFRSDNLTRFIVLKNLVKVRKLVLPEIKCNKILKLEKSAKILRFCVFVVKIRKHFSVSLINTQILCLEAPDLHFSLFQSKPLPL